MLMGPAQAFQLLHPEDLKISLDLKQLQPGTQEITLKREHGQGPFEPLGRRYQPGADQGRHVAAHLHDRADRGPDGKRPAAGSCRPEDHRHSHRGEGSSSPAGSAASGSAILTEPIDLSQFDVQRAFTPSLRYPPDIQFAGGKAPVIRVVVKTRTATVPLSHAETPERICHSVASGTPLFSSRICS